MAQGRRFTYSRWDGTQVGFDIDAESIFAEITDDLLYHGDLNAALRRMMQQGFQDRDGKQLQGLRDVLERLRRRRRDELEKHDLGGVYDDIARELREVVDTERQEVDRQLDEARASGDERRTETAQASAGERHLRLDMLPNDLAGMVKVNTENIDAALLFRQQPDNRAREHGFARSGSTDETENFTTVDVESDAVEDPVPLQIDNQVAHFNDRSFAVSRHVTFRSTRRTWQKCRRAR